MANSFAFTTPTEYSAEAESIARQRALAQALQQEGSQGAPAGQMAGQVFVPTSPLMHLAKALKGVSGAMHDKQAQDRARALGEQAEQRRTADMSLLSQALQGRQASPGGLMEDASGNVTQADALPGQTPSQSLMQALPMLRDPSLQQFALGQSVGMNKPQVVGKSLMRPDGTIIATDPASKKPEKTFKVGDVRKVAMGEQEVTQEYQQDGTWKEIGRGARFARQVAPAGGGSGEKPPKAPVGFRFSSDGETLEPIPGGPKDPKAVQLPSAALKLQQAELDAIGTAAGITADLGGVIKQIDDGKLKLGFFRNLQSEGRQLVGANDDVSKAYGSFKATLEKLRNDSLRLNKGVQTEGDAQRAWNEVLTRINDPEFVKQRLGEIQTINERAVNLRKMNVDAIRSNYGASPMDTSGYQNVPSAVGGNPKPAGGRPAVGTIENGYRFKGGDPAKPESWEKV
jgi:hypothetical protein